MPVVTNFEPVFLKFSLNSVWCSNLGVMVFDKNLKSLTIVTFWELYFMIND